MRKKSPPDAATLRALLEYSPKTGQFVRLVDVSNARAGQVAGTLHKRGYLHIRVGGIIFKAHRLAFLWMTGAWPAGEVDHINGIKTDNRWSNLRDATAFINAQNHQKARSDSKTGLRGASFCARAGKFVGQIQTRGKKKTLGYFESAEAAHAAYMQAKKTLHEGFVAPDECAAQRPARKAKAVEQEVATC